jgi:hypothetical protein
MKSEQSSVSMQFLRQSQSMTVKLNVLAYLKSIFEGFSLIDVLSTLFRVHIEFGIEMCVIYYDCLFVCIHSFVYNNDRF